MFTPEHQPAADEVCAVETPRKIDETKAQAAVSAPMRREYFIFESLPYLDCESCFEIFTTYQTCLIGCFVEH